MADYGWLDYSKVVNYGRIFFRANGAGLILTAAMLVALTGCVAYVDRPPQGSVYVVPPPETAFGMDDDYVYYPNYGVYYSTSRHEYAYRDGRAWVSRPAPRGVSVNVLLASPSVRMNFHDSPANHHAEVVRQYPKNWRPAGANPGQNRRDDHRGDH
jgi:hypothetical protein